MKGSSWGRVPSQFVRVAVVSSLSVAASGQYVPIRELDTNGLFQGDYPSRLGANVVVGSGILVGSSSLSYQPCFWDANGSNLLPPLTGLDAGFANASNAAGTVVGSSFDSNTWPGSLTVATAWIGGAAVDVSTLITTGGPALLWSATDVDSKGRILLYGVNGKSRSSQALLLDQGVLVDLGALDFFNYASVAYAMNDRGVVVGSSDVGNMAHACVFLNGGTLDLHDPSFMEDLSYAVAVNRASQVVGEYDKGPPDLVRPRAFLWDGTTAIDLSAATPPVTNANAIDDFSVVVGGSYDASTGQWTACRWEQGVVTDLNSWIDPALGWWLSEAFDIDDEGRIIGGGTLNGVPAAWILEPACKGTFTIYGTGCAGTAGLEPRLRGRGCPAPDRDFALEIIDGLPDGIGLMFLGTGNGTLTVKPGCDLQVLPLVPPVIPIVLDSLGEWWDHENLPSGTPTFDLYLQALFFDPAAAYGVSGSKPLALHFE